MGIVDSVLPHALREGAFAPIGALEFLLQMDVEFVFKQAAKPDTFPAQNTGSDHRVKEVAEPEAEVSAQGQQVIFGGVEDRFDLGIGKDLLKQGNILQNKRIYQVVMSGDGELDQADLLSVGKQAVGLGIDCNDRLSEHGFDRLLQLIG